LRCSHDGQVSTGGIARRRFRPAVPRHPRLETVLGKPSGVEAAITTTSGQPHRPPRTLLALTCRDWFLLVVGQDEARDCVAKTIRVVRHHRMARTCHDLEMTIRQHLVDHLVRGLG
jgi:hypothetical protein